jgi:putative membrane protein
MVMKLLTEQDKTGITQAIKEAEKQTSCEIMVMEVGQCDDYSSARMLWGVIIAFVSAFSVSLFYHLTITQFMAVELVGFLIGLLIINRIPVLKRLLIPVKKMRGEVHYRALAEFYNQGIYKTRAENGIFIMLSVFERMVIILADKGISSKISPDYLNTIRDKIITGIKHNKSGAIIAETIKSLGQDLKEYFPAQIDDKNELPDTILTKI